MKIYIMDRDYEVMKKLEAVVNDGPDCRAKCFTDIKALLEAVRRESPDSVLLDADTYNAVSAIKIIKNESPDTGVVMMSEDRSKASELFELGLNGFLLKPLDEVKVNEQLFWIRHPIIAKFRSGIKGDTAL